jgi:hypothetical protein
MMIATEIRFPSGFPADSDGALPGFRAFGIA